MFTDAAACTNKALSNRQICIFFSLSHTFRFLPLLPHPLVCVAHGSILSAYSRCDITTAHHHPVHPATPHLSDFQHLCLPRIPSFSLPLHTQPFWFCKQDLRDSLMQGEDRTRSREHLSGKRKRGADFQCGEMTHSQSCCCVMVIIKEAVAVRLPSWLCFKSLFSQAGAMWLSAWGNTTVTAKGREWGMREWQKGSEGERRRGGESEMRKAGRGGRG